MSMQLRQQHYGHYDENGYWYREKYCLIYCGAKCDCGPPNGQQYSSAHDKRLDANKGEPNEKKG